MKDKVWHNIKYDHLLSIYLLMHQHQEELLLADELEDLRHLQFRFEEIHPLQDLLVSISLLVFFWLSKM